jgi:hypothetical protein
MLRMYKSLLYWMHTLWGLAASVIICPFLTIQRTGSDAALSLQLVSPVPLDDPGLQTTFAFNDCEASAGESCDQIIDRAGSEVIRWIGIVPGVITGYTHTVPQASSLAFSGFCIAYLMSICIIWRFKCTTNQEDHAQSIPFGPISPRLPSWVIILLALIILRAPLVILQRNQ